MTTQQNPVGYGPTTLGPLIPVSLAKASVVYSEQWLVLESRTGELADRKIAGDWHAGSTKERAQNQIMGAAEGGLRV